MGNCMGFHQEFIALNGEDAFFEHGSALYSQLLHYKQKRDSRIADRIAGYCAQNDLLMTLDMVKAVGEVAVLRLNGQLKENTKNHKYQEFKDDVVFKAMWHMSHYCGMTQDKAAINGAKILKHKSLSDEKVKFIKPNELKKKYRAWKEEYQAFLDSIANEVPSWSDEQIRDYLKQFDLIELEDFEIGSLR